MKKIIGSHNSMSYLPPMNKWLKPFNWLFAKCQNDLFMTGIVGCVDLRVYYNKEYDKWMFAHGLIAYDRLTLATYLNMLLSKHNKYVRIILERDGYEDEFIKLCDDLVKKYPNVTFLGGYRKSDWKHLYDFKDSNIPIYQWVGSMAEDARWYEKFIPRLYAKRMNKVNMHKLKEGINLFDFL